MESRRGGHRHDQIALHGILAGMDVLAGRGQLNQALSTDSFAAAGSGQRNTGLTRSLKESGTLMDKHLLLVRLEDYTKVLHASNRAPSATCPAWREDSLQDENTEMRERLADFMPDLPARASLFTSYLPSASWFTHVILQQNSKSLFP